MGAHTKASSANKYVTCDPSSVRGGMRLGLTKIVFCAIMNSKQTKRGLNDGVYNCVDQVTHFLNIHVEPIHRIVELSHIFHPLSSVNLIKAQA